MAKFKNTYKGLLIILLHITRLNAQYNPPSNSFQDNFSSGTYVRCRYNVNISETHLNNTVNYTVRAGQSIRIMPNTYIKGFTSGAFYARIDPNYNLNGCDNYASSIPGPSVIWDNFYTGDGSVSREMRPVNYQLYPRKSNDLANVIFSGTTNNVSLIFIAVYKTPLNGVTSPPTWQGVSVVNNHFSLSIPIHAELSEYKFSYILTNPNYAGSEVTLADHVVCGDAYIISGQSNASTTDLTSQEVANLNSLYGPNTAYGKYSRTNGNMWWSNIWGVSEVNPSTMVNHVGAWALPMQYNIQATYGIPTCFINGAYGGTSIQQHIPSMGQNFYNPASWNWGPLNSLFAFLNTRVYNAGLENDISGIFWLQGDGNGNWSSSTSYNAQFAPLYDLWTTYLPNFKRFYEIQIHSWVEPGTPNQTGCEYSNEMDLRTASENQRIMPSVFPRTSVMSANGIGYHRTLSGTEIHFQDLGYIELGNRLFRLLERDVYGKTTNINDIDPPNIQSAYISSSGNHVALHFDQNISYTNPNNLNAILSVIKFNSTSYNCGYNNLTNAVITNNILEFDIVPDPLITSVSYAGFIPNANGSPKNPDTPCYLINSKNIGALSFHDIELQFSGNSNRSSITKLENGHTKENSSMSISPNPFTDKLNIRVNSNSTIKNIKIMDVSGRTVYERDGQQEPTLDLSFLTPGTYLVFAKDENGQNEKFKVIKLNN